MAPNAIHIQSAHKSHRNVSSDLPVPTVLLTNETSPQTETRSTLEGKPQFLQYQNYAGFSYWGSLLSVTAARYNYDQH